MSSYRRPEHSAPPEIFYSQDEARKYTTNSRIIEIQGKMTERAMELLNLPEDMPALILDIGCGSGLSGQVAEENGHVWIGLDISEAMLEVAAERASDGDISGDVMVCDAGEGMPFRAGSFDGAISISALQWLCNADKSTHKPAQRLYKLFSTLYAALARGTRAVFQFYPENDAQVAFIVQQAMKAGFGGGVVVDFPNSSKAKKVFLVLFTGGVHSQQLPKSLTETDALENTVKYTDKRERLKRIRGKAPKKSVEWILEKKERRRRQGKNVRPDTKYTGRRRSGKF